jgi:hypothetical protein
MAGAIVRDPPSLTYLPSKKFVKPLMDGNVWRSGGTLWKAFFIGFSSENGVLAGQLRTDVLLLRTLRLR